MITIGITTYNRKSILDRMADSLYASDIPYEYNIRVYDDASNDFDGLYLKQRFPNAKSITIRPHNMGSDENIRLMYEDFLSTKDEYFFNADSDLIFNKQWISVLMKTIKKTDGVLSAFNTEKHKYGEITCVDGISIVEKESLGSAGTLFHRDIVEMIKKDLEGYDARQFDWKWSDMLRKQGKHLYALKNSMVQHIGFSGYNSINGSFDYANGFCVDSISNGQAINDTIAEMAKNVRVDYRKKISLFPFCEVERGSKVIIYGAGKFGNDYISQVKSLGYCEIIAVCDKNYRHMDNVTNPESIRNMSYDHIIIAVSRDDIVKEIENSLTEMGIPKNKVVSGSSNRVLEINN